MIGIILAGGNGTRFSGHGCCKPLLKINGKYLIEYSLENLVALGITRAVIVVGKYRREIIDTLGNRYRGIELDYVTQPKPDGLINALYLAMRESCGQTAVLQLSDELYVDFDPTVVSTIERCDFLCGYTETQDPQQIKENYSIDCGPGGDILRCTEKPDTVTNNKKGTGFCVFQAPCLDLLTTAYGEDPAKIRNIGDYLNLLIAQGLHGEAVRIACEEININTAEKLEYAKHLFEEAKDE